MRYSLLRLRRRLRRVSLLVVGLLALGPVLQGCGGGSSPSGTAASAAIPTGRASGSVTLAEVGGQGLAVQSAWQTNAPVAADGTFDVTVSQKGAQLLSLTDADGNVRGMTVSVPAARGRQAAPLALDAHNTALACLWFNPGIIETDPERAPARLAELEGLSSFPALVTFLQNALPAAPLSDIVTRQEFNDKFGACVNEWWSTARSRDIEPDLNSSGGIQVRVANQSDKRNVSMQITNAGFRYVFLHRRGLHADGTLAEAAKVGLVPGAAPLSVGTLATLLHLPLPDALTSPYETPATYTDHVNFELDSGGCEYWIHGTGHLAGDTPPSDLTPEDGDEVVERVGRTVIQYTLMPLLDGVIGALGAADSAKVAGDIWDKVKAPGDLRDDMQAVVDAPDNTSVAVTIGKFLYDVFGQVTTLEKVMAALAEDGLISAGAATVVVAGGKVVAAALAGLAIGTALANLEQMADSWAGLPEWSKIVVRTSGDLNIQVRTGIPRKALGGVR